MLAAGLADVLVANPDPAMLGGVGDHPLDQLAARLLLVGAAGDLGAGLGETPGERVAGALELVHPDHPGAAVGGARVPLDAAAGEGGGEEVGELALHARDLAPQLDPCRPGGRPLGGVEDAERRLVGGVG